MANLLYSRPDDNLAPSATVTTPVGTPAAAYPIANLTDLNPALPVVFGGVRARIVFDFGSPVAVPLLAILHHNLTAGLDVKWQAHASDLWTAPTFDHAVTIAAADGDGYRPNAWLDGTALANYGAFRYWSLDLDNADNGAAISLGEIWLGSTIRRLTHNYEWGFVRKDLRQGRTRLETAAGVVWAYPATGRRRALSGRVTTSDAGLTAIDAWRQACNGIDRATVIVPAATDDAWLVRWDEDAGHTGEFKDVNIVTVGWTEVARGPAV